MPPNLSVFSVIFNGVFSIFIMFVVFIPAANSGIISVLDVLSMVTPKQFLSILRGINIFDNLDAIPTQINGSIPTIEQAQYYNHFAAASFCYGSLSSWTCEDCVAAGPDVKLVKVFYEPRKYPQAFLTINSIKREMVLSFRGSITLWNILENLTAEKVSIPSLENKKILVHKGGLKHWLNLKIQVMEALRSIISHTPVSSLVIVGHSFGSIPAGIALVELTHSVEFSNLSYSMYTYGGQRVGNLNYALLVNSLDIPIIRVVNNADSISHTYPSYLGYVHTRGELWINGSLNIICSKDVLEDPECSNSLGPLYDIMDHAQYWDVEYPPDDCLVSSLYSYIFPAITDYFTNEKTK